MPAIESSRQYSNGTNTMKIINSYRKGSATEGLVGHWPLNEDNYTVSGKIMGTIVGSVDLTYLDTAGEPTFVTGPIDDGVDFAGTGTSTTKISGIDATLRSSPLIDSYSTSIWFKGTNPDYLQTGSRLIDTAPTSGTYMYDTMMLVSESTDRVRGLIYDSAANSTQANVETSDALDDEWHLITHVVDNNADELRLYLDDSLIAATENITTTWAGNSTRRFTIGNQNVGGKRLTGAVADCRRFDRALTIADVQAIWDLKVN